MWNGNKYSTAHVCKFLLNQGKKWANTNLGFYEESDLRRGKTNEVSKLLVKLNVDQTSKAPRWKVKHT